MALAASLLAAAGRVGAEEGGSGHYVPGATASFIDLMPGKPGIAYVNAFLYYSGSAAARRDIPIAGDLVAGLKGTSYADSSIFLAEMKVNSLPIGYAVALAIPYVWMDVSGEVVGPLTRKRSDSADGLGDIMFSPLMIGWTHEALKLEGYLNIYAPTGEYDVGRLANPGKNFWTFEPGVAASNTIGGIDIVSEAKWLPELEVTRRLKGDFVWFKIGAVF